MITNHSIKNFSRGILRCAMVLPLLLALPAATSAQRASARATPEPNRPTVSRQDDTDPMTSIEEEMRAKRAIKYAEKEHRENLERAHELADLGWQLAASFKKNEQLSREDLKKLERLEKLTKAIRNAAGGSESEKESDRHSMSLNVNFDKMIGVIESLADRVEKTPRHVISAAVIDEANVLLELIGLVRQLSAKG